MTTQARPRWRTLALLLALSACTRRLPPNPVVVLTKWQHDFGPLWIGEVRQHRFHIENRGGKELVLDPIRSSCGCLVAKLDSPRLAAGAATDLIVELHADKGPTLLEKGVTINTNDPDVPLLTLMLRAETKALYVFSPPLVDLPAVVLGDPLAVDVPVQVADGTAVTFGVPTCPEKGFGCEVVAPSASSATLRVTFSGDALPGRRLFHVVIPTGHPLVAEARLPVQAIVVARLVADPPDLLDFGKVARASGAVRDVTIRHRGKTPLTCEPHLLVDARATLTPSLTASLTTIEPGREWRLRVVLAPGSPGDGLVGRIIVRLEEPHEPSLILSLAGRLHDGAN